MSNFSQWWNTYQASGAVRQFTWVCGSESVLIEDILSSVKSCVSPATWDYVPLDASESSVTEIREEILQHTLSIGNRLVVVRRAQDLDTDRGIVDIVKARKLFPRTYVVYVSDDPKIPVVEEGKSRERPGYLKTISAAKGQVVECGPFTNATARHAVAWVMSKRPMRSGVAGYLLERANGDLRLVRDLCSKLSIFSQEPTISMIDELLREHPRDSFSNALMALDRKTALLALLNLPPEDYQRTLGQLDANLGLSGLVHDMLVAHKSVSEISTAAGNQRFLVPDVIPVARHYDAKRRANIRSVLVDADEALRGGETIAVMESVVALW